MAKFFSIRKPRLRVTKKGLKVQGPSARIGSRAAGVNVSKSGVSVSGGTKQVRYNSRRGWSMGCALPVLLALLAVAVGVNFA